MSTNLSDRTLALAGLYQCVELVVQLAWQGHMEQAPFETCLASLFKFDVDNYAEVYGGISGVKLGLEVMAKALRRQDDPHSTERTRYSVMLLFLERKLQKNPQHVDIIKSGIESASAQLNHFELTHINVISKLAEVYREAISSLGPKIIVQGEQSVLSNTDNASRIRALLLTGIRAVVLWRQAGGKRWRLLFERNALLREIDVLLARA